MVLLLSRILRLLKITITLVAILLFRIIYIMDLERVERHLKLKIMRLSIYMIILISMNLSVRDKLGMIKLRNEYTLYLDLRNAGDEPAR